MIIMKKIFLLLATAVTLFTACHDEEYVPATVDRQGLTSLTAIFASGPFVNQEMAKLNITDDTQTRYVIEVPWFYPETSDDETAPYMTEVRVYADLEPNCFIEPGLTMIDLTKENHFTYTNAAGQKKDIIITGERVKSNKCELLAFSLVEPAIAGVIDKANKAVSLISAEDLSACLGEAGVSAHASISPDPSAQPLNYNEEVEFTVTAHNGVDKAVYKVVKAVPEKIPAGFNANSLELLFNFDPVATLGMPAYSAFICPSMAAIKGHLIVCTGDGSAPIYMNRITGQKLGSINLGSAVAGSVTSDEADHMLIVNHAQGGETVNIYVTDDVTKAPELFHSFVNSTSLPMGAKMKVIGNIAQDAIIMITNEGLDGVSSSSHSTGIVIRDGIVVSEQVVDLSAGNANWGSSPVNTSTVVAASIDPADGCFFSHYAGGGGTLDWIKADGSVGFSMLSEISGWALNPNCLDSKQFNNMNYMALFIVSHFPHWGYGPQLYVFNSSDPSAMAAGSVDASPALVLARGAYEIDWYQQGNAGTASGDVLIAPSADGYKFYVYYYDHNSQVIGGYTADCIAQ